MVDEPVTNPPSSPLPPLPDAPPLPGDLQRFETNLADPRARELVLRTYAWAAERGVLEAAPRGRAGMIVIVASAYARLCAPVAPPPAMLDIAARFTLVFLCVDDAEGALADQLLSTEWDWAIGTLTPALAEWRADIDLPRAREGMRECFRAAFQTYLTARRQEPAVGTLAIDAHWDLRRTTIFMDPYVCQWIISLGIAVDSFDPAPFAKAYALGKDIVLLSNDLGSIDRDRPGGDSPDDLNLVNAYCAERGWSVEEALERLIARHNEMVSAFRDEVALARCSATWPRADEYAELLTGVVDGNLGCLFELGFRYQRVGHILARLEWVVPRAPST